MKAHLFNLLIILCFTPTITQANSSNHCGLQECLGVTHTNRIGFLVAAPDRGYMGNQRVRHAFEKMNSTLKTELVFITNDKMKPYLIKALNSLNKQIIDKIIVLPLFYSISHPKLDFFRQLLAEVSEHSTIVMARPFGNTYLAVEMLIERMKSVSFNKDNPLLIIGHGSSNKDKTIKMTRDIQRIANLAIKGYEDKAVNVVILPGDRHSKSYKEQSKNAWQTIKTLASDKGIKTLIPLHMGSELDGHMSVDRWTEDQLPSYLSMSPFQQNETLFFSLWLQRESNRYLSARDAPIGVVFHAHGSDFHWNQGMRESVKDLSKEMPVEFAFSMADSNDLTAAVERLEKRGVGVVVIVRVFGMKASFRHGVEHLIGLDVDAPELCKTEDEEDGHDGEPPMRLRTPTLVVTEGGLGDSDYFAQAMLEKALQLSTNPEKDSVIIVAHGKGSKTANQQWLNVLDSLVNKMNTKGGYQFKSIQYQTWQEDWEDKRGERINAIKKMVQDANVDGGQAIIIPARTTGEGRAKQFLKGEKYIAGKGFAPHPLFKNWVLDQVKRGAKTVKQTRHVWYPVLPKNKTYQ